MNCFERGIKFLTDPMFRFDALYRRGKFENSTDEEYIKARWKAFYGTDLDLENPKTLCEKLQWLKLNYRKADFTMRADKYEAKEFVSKLLGEQYVIPTIGVWDNVEEIPFEKLPNQFVLKPTHDSGGFVVCRDKKVLNVEEAKEKLKRCLSRNYYLVGREWPYRNIKPRIIAEPLIESLGKPDSIEYKTTCFDGKVGFVTICQGPAHVEFEKRSNDHFDVDFKKLNWYVAYKPAKEMPKKPAQWDELISFCEKLSAGIPYLRVDTYIVDGQILFGEMTFYTWGGFMKFVPKEWDRKLGDMLVLPERHVED